MSTQTSNIQQVISKTQAVERLYQTQKQQPDTDQQKFAAVIQQKNVDKNEKTQEASKAEQQKIDKDRRDKLSLSYKKKKKKKKEFSENKKSAEDMTGKVGRLIDITI